MKNETTIIERLEKLASGIEMMLDRPDMVAQHPEALEMSIITALESWATIIDSPLSVRFLWREEVIFAHPDADGYSTISLAYAPQSLEGAYLSNPELSLKRSREKYLAPIENRKETVKRITYHMRRVWDQLKHTGGCHEQDSI